MKQGIKLKEQSVHSIVKEMAEAMGAQLDVNENEHCFEVPKHLGSGYVKAYEFENGVGVLVTDVLLKYDFILTFEKSVVHPLKFIFNREDEIYHKFSDENKFNAISGFESLIVSGSHEREQIFKFKAKHATNIFDIEINRKLFEPKIDSFEDQMHEDLVSIFRDLNGVKEFRHKGFYSLDVNKYIDEFVHSELDGFMESVYQEGKVFEIFIHQLAVYLDDLNNEEDRVILRKSTVKKLDEAVSIIKEEMDTMLTVKSLANRVGVNQNTLQAGFKKLHQQSVNAYIRDVRLEKAKVLMESTDLNVTEITYKVGINSRSYFSKLFKKKYKISPKKFIKSAKAQHTKSKSA